MCLFVFKGFNLIDIQALATFTELQKVEIPYNQLTGKLPDKFKLD